MKIGKIAKLCKAKKIVAIFEHEGDQWIGDGYGMYLLDCEQQLDANSLLTIFDVEPAKRAEWHCVHTNAPDVIKLDNTDTCDEPFEEFGVGLKFRDDDLVIGRAAGEIIMFPNKYLNQIRESDYLRLFVRKTGGIKYLIVKEGFLVKAAISLCSIKDVLLINELREVVRGLEVEESKNPQATFDDLLEEAHGKETMECIHG